MLTEAECRNRDLLVSPSTRLLFWLPWLAIMIGIFIGGVTRTVLWTSGFGIAGIMCLLNARRCGRRHCVYTGPLYLLAALAALLHGTGALPLGAYGWDLILDVSVALSLFFCFILEKALGRYPSAH